MRAVHYCATCDFRLPYCVRTDRRFCSARCRVWAFRHPGQKRRYFVGGRVRAEDRHGRSRSKLMAAAIEALANARHYAAKMEAAALTQKDTEQRLLAEMAKVRANLAEDRLRHSAERDFLRNQLAKTKARLEQVEEEKLTKTKLSHKRLHQTERLLARLKRVEGEVAAKKSELGRTKEELAEARRTQEQMKTAHESQLRALQSEVLTVSRARDELTIRLEAFACKAGDLQNRTDQADKAAAAERAHMEAIAIAERLKRRLQAEQERRIIAEKRIVLLLGDRDNQKKATQPDAHAMGISRPIGLGQYQRHAAIAGYNITDDPLFDLMRRDVVVADCYADWQATNMQRMTSRRRDSNQTLDEQAYVAALAARWRLIDHPHIRLGMIPRWSLLGFMLDDKSEKYLTTITNERIVEMKTRIDDDAKD